MDLITKYQNKLREMQEEFDEAYKNQYAERCDQLDDAIELCEEIVKDLKDQE